MSGSARAFSPNVLERLLARDDLDGETVEQVFGAILDGAMTDGQIAAFLIALRAKGETAVEIAAGARALRTRARMVRPRLAEGAPLVDTCGTGGDGAQTFNVSTVAAIVVAGCGVTVAKHGNRAVSSRAGSADLVEALGVPLEGDSPAFDDRLSRSMEEHRLAFFFAPRHHAALRHVGAVRRELGVRTVFNLLGPIANPAGATHQLIGIFDDGRRAMLAEVLRLLGTKRAWVVHGAACEGAPRGLDEVSPSGPTRITELRADGSLHEHEVTPADAGLDAVSLDDLRGGDAHDNAGIAREVLAGNKGAARTAVVLNVACALVIAGTAVDLHEGRERAEMAIDRGDAAATLERWRDCMLS